MGKAKANTIPIANVNVNPLPQAMPKQQTYQPEIGRNDRYESKQHEIEINNVQTAHYNVNQQQQQVQQREEKQMDAMEDEDDIAMEESRCDLAAYNVQLRKYKNETVKFHFKMQQENNMSMTQRYEQMQIKETEKSEKINEMKKEYDRIRKELSKVYCFQAKPFQITSSTDYALFQLDSIRQKSKMEKEVKHERSKSVEMMDEDGVDCMLDSLSNQINSWSRVQR